MKIQSIAYLLVGASLFLLAACSAQPTAVPDTGELPDAALAAQRWLAQELGEGIPQVEIVGVEEQEWSDSCLGLGGPAESCARVITPGWRVTAQVNGQEYEVRTDQTGSVVRMVQE